MIYFPKNIVKTKEVCYNMSAFDNIKIDTSFGDWIQVFDDESSWTIEDFLYSSGVDGKITYPHCEKCVAVNHCYFKNEKGKKPEKFNYSKFPLEKLLQLIPGLYHPLCHCEEIPIKSPTIDEIYFLLDKGKIDWLYLDKKEWIESMGYIQGYDIVPVILEETKKSFLSGNYQVVEHSKYGFKINVFISIPGINEKAGKIYKVKSCYMVFPNGKLKCNTLIGGWQ